MNLAIKIAKFWLSKSIFYVKNHPNPSNLFSLKNINQEHNLYKWHLLFTVIFEALFWPKFPTFIPNWELICHRPFQLTQARFWCGSSWTILKRYLLGRKSYVNAQGMRRKKSARSKFTYFSRPVKVQSRLKLGHQKQ